MIINIFIKLRGLKETERNCQPGDLLDILEQNIAHNLPEIPVQNIAVPIINNMAQNFVLLPSPYHGKPMKIPNKTLRV